MGQTRKYRNNGNGQGAQNAKQQNRNNGDAAQTQPILTPEQLERDAVQKAKEAKEAAEAAKAAKKAAAKAAKEAEKKAAKAAKEAAKARALELEEAKREWRCVHAWVPMKGGVEIGVHVKDYHDACNPHWDPPDRVLAWVYSDGSLGPRLTEVEQLEYNARGYSH